LAGEVVQTGFNWLPELGLNVTLMLDGLGFFFALLILGIGLLIITYARFYLAREDNMGEFFTYLLLFQGAMVGIVLSDNILLLLIFWELTSLSSFLLIGYWKHLEAGRQDPSGPDVCARAFVDPAGCVHEVSTIPVPLLVAPRDGRADACVGLSALRDDGEGGHFLDGAHVACAVGHA